MLGYTKQIRDPVLGWIWLTDSEVKLIDSCPYVQRLRYIHQLGLAHLVYPTARHTRFEHSLGTMHISTKIFQILVERENSSKILRDLTEKLDMKDQKISSLLQHLRITALIHDIGHYPFSHSLDNYLASIIHNVLVNSESREILKVSDEEIEIIKKIASSFYIAKEHEWITYMLLSRNRELINSIHENVPEINISLIKDILFIDIFHRLLNLNIELEHVKDDIQRVKKYDNDVLRGLRLLHSIISSSLDSDRLDYMLRDLYFTGASVSTNITLCDIERMLSNMDVIVDDENVVITYNEKARASLEGFIIARYNLYKWVYLHHKVTLMSTLMRNLYLQIMKNLDKLSNIDMVVEHVKDIVSFINGTIDGKSIMRLTDYYVLTLLSRYYDELVNVLGDAGKYVIDSILIRKTYFKTLWKRDVEFERILESTTGETAKEFNARIGALIYEITRNPSIYMELLSIFYKRLINELKIASEIYGINSNLKMCIDNLCKSIENDQRGQATTIVLGCAYFEPDVTIYISSGESKHYIDIKEISPLATSVKEAWDRSPKVFIYVNMQKIGEACGKYVDNIEFILNIVEVCAIKALDTAIKDLVNIHSRSSLHRARILQ